MKRHKTLATQEQIDRVKSLLAAEHPAGFKLTEIWADAGQVIYRYTLSVKHKKRAKRV